LNLIGLLCLAVFIVINTTNNKKNSQAK